MAHRIARLFAAAWLFLTPAGVALADTQFADPPPSMDNPRRILLQLTSDDPKVANNLLSNAVNLQKFYTPDHVELAIVAYGPGLRALVRKDSTVADRVSSLIRYNVSFVACGNTMETMGWTKADLIEGVEVVTAGIAEIVERRMKGWAYVAP